MSSYEKFAKKYFGQLKGYTITDFKLEKEYDLIFPVFIMKKGGQEIKVSVSQDEEGNGGGHLFIDNVIDMEEQNGNN
jgi:hypothetical protein|tara:strand:+ start:179 stop:409 length:231 start_codon:yes stop_codon:yes gene_type:complete